MTASKTRATRWLTAVLLALAAVPVAAGAARLGSLAGGADISAENARFFAAPVPVVLHVVGAILFSVLGAFQFVPRLRSRKSGWHRKVGRLLVVCGLVVALSGLWMTQFYPNPVGDGDALYVLRMLFGTGMLVSMLMAIAAIRRRDFADHGAWMTRAYAIAMGAGTQVLTGLPYILLVGKERQDEGVRAVLMGAGWVINLAVAEWRIRRAARPRTASALRAAQAEPAAIA
ncbi:MAG: DUF2306 domain-containing protein [Myxococcota bacterium]